MATSRSCIKRLKGPVKQFFTVSGGWNSSTCTWNSSFPEVLYKRSVLKNSKFTDKHKKQSSWGVLSKKDVLKYFAKFTEKHFCRSLFFSKVAGWTPQTFRSSHWICSVKQGPLKKVTPTKVFPCEFCELFKNTYFVEDLQTAGSETPERGCLFNKVASLTTWSSLIVSGRDFSTGISLWTF